MIEIALVLILLAFTGVLAMLITRLRRATAAASNVLFHAQIMHTDAQRLLCSEKQLQEVRHDTETARSDGTSLLRKVHSGIAAAPPGLLDGGSTTHLAARATRMKQPGSAAGPVISAPQDGAVTAAPRRNSD